MAVTVTVVPMILSGGKKLQAAGADGYKMVVGAIAFASTYAAGGITFTVPLTNIDYVNFEQAIGTSYAVQYDRTNAKAKVYDMSSATAPVTELASDTSVASLTTVPFIAYGR